MNVLEEIFEELEERGNIQFSSYTKPLIAVEDVLEIIRSHMDLEERGNIQFSSYTKPLIAVEDVLEIIRSHMDEREVFKFDFNRVKSFDCQCGRHYVNTYDGGWIPVDERLPEEGEKILYDMQLVTLEDGEVCLGVYRNQENEWWTRRQQGEE